MKIKVGLLVGGLALAGLYVGTYAYNSLQPAKAVLAQGKHLEFENIEEMEDQSELIVIGKKTSNGSPIIVDDGTGGIMYGYTISNFEIKKIIKDETGKVIQKKQAIKVLENAAVKTDLLGKTVSYTQEGYELMKENKRYVLFLSESQSDANTFIPMGAIYGKVPLESMGSEIEFNGDEENIKSITKAAIDKYKKELSTEE